MASNDEPKDDKTTDESKVEESKAEAGKVEESKVEETKVDATPAEPEFPDQATVALAKKDAPTSDVPAADAPTSDAQSKSTPVGLLAALGVLGVLLVALAVLWNPWFGPFNGSREVADHDDDKATAETAACDVASKLFTYDYNKIDDFFDAVQGVSTGRFGTGFAADKEQLRTLFVQSQVVSRPDATSCKVQMIGDEYARVQMQGTQIVASSVAAQGQEQREHINIYIDLQKTDDGWKVYDLSPVDLDSASTLPGTQTVPGNEQPAPAPEPSAAPAVPNP